MATARRQFIVRLDAKDAASLRKLSRAECRTLTDTIRHLIRREAAARLALAKLHAAAAK